jgi:hypothetical protein
VIESLDDATVKDLLDLELFASAFFKIKKKNGSLADFNFNTAQKYIHSRLEAQKEATGKVRAVILKGRQQGCSTYVQARYFHKTITQKGVKTFILTHESEATQNLFDITKRYYDNLADDICPIADTDASKKLYFSALDSGYAVGTARNRGTGRSATIQLLHGSEVAFWEHASEHAQGLLQAVSGEPGTEVILESTANGVGNYYYQKWYQALNQDDEWQAIFVPWFWQDEYRDYTLGFQMSFAEQELYEQYKEKGLQPAHLAWRRKKLKEFAADEEAATLKFNQEYPLSWEEAFTNLDAQVFIHAKHVKKARENAHVTGHGARVAGVDLAYSESGDKTVIVRRQGRLIENFEIYQGRRPMELASILVNILKSENLSKMYIDEGGFGVGVIDRVIELGYGHLVVAVNSARKADDTIHFANVRAELWSRMRDFFWSQDVDVSIPDRDDVQRDICNPRFKTKSNGQLLIESKQDMRKRGIESPDYADAIALTFFDGLHTSETTTFEVNRIPENHMRGFI